MPGRDLLFVGGWRAFSPLWTCLLCVRSTEQPWRCAAPPPSQSHRTARCRCRASPSVCPASCPSAAHCVTCRRCLARLHLQPSNQMIVGEKRIKFPSSGNKAGPISVVCTPFRCRLSLYLLLVRSTLSIASLQHMSQLPFCYLLLLPVHCVIATQSMKKR